MKRNLLIASAFVLTSGLLILNGCKKDDTTAPVVTIIGNTSIDNPLNTAYSDQGATANDDEDGTITVSTSGDVNVDKTGTYEITYSATDKAGNVGTATRTVHVYNEAEGFAGVYLNAVDTCQVTGNSTFDATVTASDSVNHLVIINNFGAFGPSINVYAKITGNTSGSNITITVPQSLGGTASLTQIYQNESKVITGGTSPKFMIHYKWDDGINNDVCTSTYSR